MNRKHLITLFTAIAAVASASSAFAHTAGEAQSVFDFDAVLQQAQSIHSRAAVRAEAVEARDAGTVASGEAGDVRFADGHAETTLSRAQVRAQTIEALRLGLIPQGEAALVIAAPMQVDSAS
jgi:hypothetical protein